MFAIGRGGGNEDFFLLNILNVKREKQTYPRRVNSKLSSYISDWGSSYYNKDLYDVKIICYDRKIYIPQSLHRRVLDWYHFYINHPFDGVLDKQSERYTTAKAL